MKIKKCPDCAQYIHFDGEVSLKKCWNCGAMTDFSLYPNAEQKLWQFADSQLSLLLAPFSNLARWKRWGRFALVAALPCAVAMLLLCNSFQIHVVTDLAGAFMRQPLY